MFCGVLVAVAVVVCLRSLLSVVVYVPHTTQNLLISRCCFAEDNKDKNYNTRAQPFYRHETFCYAKLPLPLPLWFSSTPFTTIGHRKPHKRTPTHKTIVFIIFICSLLFNINCIFYTAQEPSIDISVVCC